ncbi:AAA domain-containing protein [Winogradskya humida]|uniref:AAA domain-containing protein n=1 Tax=Winogradskya humida TaxID=113566 RepID=A0ABQ4A5D3_9ACTN|nr:AAA domain-containing protein [Actinoplanes humidus]GIE26074.1 hypothetical protein Ahu01nite_091760 [Actinoplanes humidus]
MTASHLDRAVRLFEFLARAQQSAVSSPRTCDGYELAWAGDLPRHPAVHFAHWSGTPAPGDEIAHVDRIHPEAEEADAEKRVRDAYKQLFAMQAEAAANPEEQELVLAVGCLVWQPEGHEVVRRHLVTTPVTIDLDPVSGTLRVHAVEGADPLRIELDMLGPHLTGSPHLAEAREVARAYAQHPLNREAIGELLHRLANSLDPAAGYRESEAPSRETPSTPEVSLAPAIVLRRRDRQGIVELLETIRAQLLDSGVVPEGILPLVDPDHRPAVRTDPTPGAMVGVDDDVFLPLPVNEQQLRVLQQVDRHAQTLVQGPPGTGKTHTAAALLCHLLAQGKRVLVTAQTDRALKEVRAKLPEAVRPLSVAVVGASREDLTDLRIAVDTISQQAVDYDERRGTRTAEHHLMAVDRLRRHRATLHRRIIDVRSAEIARHERGPYRGTLAAIAAAHRLDEPRHGWIRAWMPVESLAAPPLTASQVVEWLWLLRDGALNADEGPAYDTLPEPGALMPLADFAAAVRAEADAATVFEAFLADRQHPAYPMIRTLPKADRESLRAKLHRIAGIADELARSRQAWMPEALVEVGSGRDRVWRERAQQVRVLLDQAEPLVRRAGVTEIAPQATDLAPLVTLADQLRRHLSGGSRIRVGADGMPALGLLSAKPVRAARELLDQVRVNGNPPTTLEAVDGFLAWAQLQELLARLDRFSPSATTDTAQERLAQHRAELDLLDRVLTLGTALKDQNKDLPTVRAYARLVDAAAAEEVLFATRTVVDAAALPVLKLPHDPASSPALRDLLTAVHNRDTPAYAAAANRIVRLAEVRALVTHRDELAATLGYRSPALRDAIASTAADRVWDKRLANWHEAWDWAVTGKWLLRQRPADINRLQTEAAETETAIRGHVEQLAAARAWRHACAPDRITGSARANLQQYGQLVRRLGKGAGKYAAQRRAEIRQAMDRCRPSVPVWIMPIYRIAEQLRVQPDMFDVVIVDEASQAGLSAAFLQYLAPTIVVIGDDRQVSPAAVGVDQEDLRNLAAQYLHDDPYRASWQDPQRSLFDEAKMRFGGHIPLVEHRRCVPEIIEFSNRVAYEPERIRLVPVRQYGADRLDPVKPVHIEDGYLRGTTDRTNPPEAMAIADQLVACAADPRYDGLTFGVISLRGPHQAKLIESLLLDRLDPAQWEQRDLRCGDSADFQGSERDVMFLSMVTAAEPGRRPAAATTEMYLQRYNVAASRAKDQMWVYHSLRPADFADPDDLRRRLLDYCYEVAAGPPRHAGADQPPAVPDDVLTSPFRSLFEQRVHNRITARGYTVLPHHETMGYRIDLVVSGPDSTLAVLCDADTWQGPDRYENDLIRQRELSRCGWEFFRIPQSAFVIDEPAVLRDLWSALDRRGIHPALPLTPHHRVTVTPRTWLADNVPI